MKRSLFLLILLATAFAVRAQDGFAGKRMVLKLDAYSSMLNRCPNVGAEILLNRSLTLSAELSGGWQQTRQTYIVKQKERVYYSDFTDDYVVNHMADRAGVAHIALALSVRKYLGNRDLVPAPYGAFFSLGYKKGRINKIKGDFNESLLFSSTAYSETDISYTAHNIPYYSIQAGFGRHSFISSRLSLDFLLGLNFNKFDTAFGNDGNMVVSGVTNNYGPNVIRIFTNKKNKDITSYNFGVFLNFSVGLLLF